MAQYNRFRLFWILFNLGSCLIETKYHKLIRKISLILLLLIGAVALSEPVVLKRCVLIKRNYNILISVFTKYCFVTWYIEIEINRPEMSSDDVTDCETPPLLSTIRKYKET